MFKKVLPVFILFVFLCSVSEAITIRQLFRESDRQGFETILKLAKSGNIEAMYYAGLSYEIGNGTKLDYKKAFKWYKMAANAGHPRAQYNLAFMYEYGFGTKKNLVAAYKWFFISGHDRECHLVAQKMSSKQIEEAKELARKWGLKHGFELRINSNKCCNEF